MLKLGNAKMATLAAIVGLVMFTVQVEGGYWSTCVSMPITWYVSCPHGNCAHGHTLDYQHTTIETRGCRQLSGLGGGQLWCCDPPTAPPPPPTTPPPTAPPTITPPEGAVRLSFSRPLHVTAPVGLGTSNRPFASPPLTCAGSSTSVPVACTTSA